MNESLILVEYTYLLLSLFSAMVLFGYFDHRVGERGITFLTRISIASLGWPLLLAYLVLTQIPTKYRWLLTPKEDDETEEEV